MRYFHFKSNDCCTYKTEYIRNEYEFVADVREQIANTGCVSLEEISGVAWNDEEECWERELTHEESLDAAIKLNRYGDFQVREVEPDFN